MRLVNIVGSNATGKSTRLKSYIDTLGDDYSIYRYHLTKKKRNGQKIDEVIRAGRRYRQEGDKDPLGDTLVIGIPTADGGWTSGDHTWGTLGDQKSITKFIERCRVARIETIIVESYYFGSAYLLRRPRVLDLFEEAETYLFYYDDIDTYLDRCRVRSGKSRDLEWAINSAGWKANHCFKKMDGEEGVTRVSIDAPKDYFIEELNGH